MNTPEWLKAAPSGESALFRVARLVMVGEFAFVWLLRATGSWWGARSPDSLRTYPFRFMGGTVVYFSPAVGWIATNGLWIFAGLLGALLLIRWLEYRERGRRPGAA